MVQISDLWRLRQPLLCWLAGGLCALLLVASQAAHAADEPDLRERALERLRIAVAAAQAAEADGDPRVVNTHRLAAIAAAASAQAPELSGRAQADLALALRRQGDIERALAVARVSVAGWEGAAGERLMPPALIDLAREAALWLVEQGRLDDALLLMQRLKEAEFAGFVSGGDGLVMRLPVLVLDAHESLLFEHWNSFALAGPRVRSAEASAVRPGTGAERESRWVAEGLALLDALPAARPRSLLRPVLPDRVTIPEGELWVHSVVAESRVLLVLRSSAGGKAQVLEWPREALVREVEAALAQARSPVPVLAPLQTLHRRLGAVIEAAASAIGARRLVFELDGPLRYVPLAALHDGQAYLGERFILESRRGVDPGTPVTSLRRPAAPLRAFGASREAVGMRPLRAVVRELCLIVAGPVRGLTLAERLTASFCGPDGTGKGSVAGAAWLDDEFTVERLQFATAEGASQGEALLHIGTHFVLLTGHMGRSWMLMGKGQRLQLDELARMRFDGHALVTLSACETGLDGNDAQGQEVEGLHTLVLRRGARAVLASQWHVPDDSSSVLMEAFYRELAKTSVTPAQALQSAQASVRGHPSRAWMAPLHWAGFQLTTARPVHSPDSLGARTVSGAQQSLPRLAGGHPVDVQPGWSAPPEARSTTQE